MFNNLFEDGEANIAAIGDLRYLILSCKQIRHIRI
jgi:hypothetical protein